jgi:beta-phosphoglucomutase
VARALVFDFNGTLSDDEDVMYEVFAAIFAQEGRPLSRQEYLDVLAGLADDETVRVWLGHRDDIDSVVARRVEGYRARICDGRTISPAMRVAVAFAAERVPLAIVSGAARAEIDPVVRAAGIDRHFSAIVASGDVRDGKPHPEGYLRALELLRRRLPGLEPADVTVLEDTPAGIAAAKGAGMRCVALARTLPPERLHEADEIVDAVDRALLDRLIG